LRIIVVRQQNLTTTELGGAENRELNLQFHNTIARVSGNELLNTFVHALHRVTEAGNYVALEGSEGRAAWQDHVDHHVKILHAIEHRDPDARHQQEREDQRVGGRQSGQACPDTRQADPERRHPAQPEPVRLGSLKTELGQRWPMTSLLDMLKAARHSDSTEELDQMQAEADDILRATLLCFEHGAVEEGALTAFNIALEQFHNAVADRKALLMSVPQNLQRATAQFRAASTA